jgi:hypothetical protein
MAAVFLVDAWAFIATNLSQLCFHNWRMEVLQLLRESLVFVEVFAGNVILGHFTGVDFPALVFSGIFDTRYHLGLERVAFLD